MKATFSSRIIPGQIGAILCSVLLAASAFGLSETSPYGPISGRNVFSLKPAPLNTPTNTQPVVAAPGIELQGFTTILGRSQVLLKVKLPPRPPEPAKDQSLVLDIGQREGDIEIVSIDARAGTVSLKNQGTPVSLNLKDHAAKLSAAPAVLPPPVAPRLPGAIPAPAAMNNPASSPGGGTIPLPTRSLRSGTESGSTTGVNGPGGYGGVNNQNAEAANHPPEVNVANYAISQARNEEARRSGALIPKLPKHPFLKDQE